MNTETSIRKMERLQLGGHAANALRGGGDPANGLVRSVFDPLDAVTGVLARNMNKFTFILAEKLKSGP